MTDDMTITKRVAEAKAKRERSWIESGCKNTQDWCGYHRCTSECPSLIRCGPGHQSKFHCEIKGEHEQHKAEIMREVYYWSGELASSGFFDESPE